jgi:hypothetical protein
MKCVGGRSHLTALLISLIACLSLLGLRSPPTGGRAESTAQQSIALAASNPNNKLAITFPSSCCPGGTVGTSYSQAFDANGGLKPYHWSIARGELPPGLQISSGYPEGNPGSLSGTPTTAGTFGFVVRVTDSAGDHVDMSGKITVH